MPLPLAAVGAAGAGLVGANALSAGMAHFVPIDGADDAESKAVDVADYLHYTVPGTELRLVLAEGPAVGGQWIGFDECGCAVVRTDTGELAIAVDTIDEVRVSVGLDRAELP